MFHRGSEAYSGGVKRVIGRKALMFVIYLALVGATMGLFKIVPGGFRARAGQAVPDRLCPAA